jgi:hypothetical protein
MTTPFEQSEDTLAILVEILSCRDLIVSDKRSGSSDPYVKAKLGTKDLHQTKCVHKRSVFHGFINVYFCIFSSVLFF